MANGIYVASSGAKARLEQLETTSHNLANLMTAGFKRQEAIYSEVHNEVMNRLGSPDQAQGVRMPNRFLPEDRINTKIDDRFTYWSQGNLDETGNVLDLVTICFRVGSKKVIEKSSGTSNPSGTICLPTLSVIKLVS